MCGEVKLSTMEDIKDRIDAFCQYLNPKDYNVLVSNSKNYYEMWYSTDLRKITETIQHKYEKHDGLGSNSKEVITKTYSGYTEPNYEVYKEFLGCLEIKVLQKLDEEERQNRLDDLYFCLIDEKRKGK